MRAGLLLMDIAKLVTVSEAAKSGRRFAFGDAWLVIAASGNVNHQKALRRLYEPHGRAISHGGALEPGVATAIDDEAMAEAVLVGWEGIDRDGAPLPYSKENAIWILSNVAVIRQFVVKASEDAMLFTRGVVDATTDALKKS